MDKIKVAVRSRPLNKRELEINSSEIVTINENQVLINDFSSIKDGRTITKAFTFDCCFDSSDESKANFADQKKVFDDLGVELLDNVFAGYNTCIFAYGQTGSGKSYTMMGMENEQKGLIPRLCENLFEKITSKSNEEHLFKIEVSYMEIYNEKVRDLLDPSGSKQNLKLREHRLLGVYVDGLSQLAVSNYKDIEVLMNKGNKSRTVAATNMNAESSRSHAVFCVQVSQNIIDKQSELSGEKLSRLSLVDLAGSEKVSKTGAEGFRLKEGCNINKSLTTLGLVISTLADNSNNKSKFIPYRDSVLTWLLKDSLGGNSKTVMISTISTASDNYDETLSTLRYADRAKRILNNAIINEDPNAKLIRSLREELETLKKELEKAKEQLGTNGSESLNDRFKESEKLYNEISKPWTERLADSEKVQQELTQTLQSMGISVQSSGIKVEKEKYFLVNINADPSMNELLVYYLKETTIVGRPNAEIKQDIQLIGPGVALEHCVFHITNNCVYITPLNSSKTRINGLTVKKETLLQHGDRIELGINHFFRLNCPSMSESPSNLIKSEYDLSNAQEEILYSKLKEQDDLDDSNTEVNKSAMSTSSSSSSIGQPIYKIIQNSTQLSDQLNKDDTTIHILNGFKKLRDQLLKTHTLAREANSISKELGLNLSFSVTLHTPARNLTPNHKKDSFLFEPAFIVRSKANNEQRILVDTEKFEYYILYLRDIYFIFQNNTKLIEDAERKSNIIDPIVDLVLDTKLNSTLIGVANVYLDSLFVDSCIVFEYDVPIINESGQLNGKLKIKLERKHLNYEDYEENENNRMMKFKLNIVEALDLPRASNNSIYCQYHFWVYTLPFIVRQHNDYKSVIKFDYINEFSIEMTEEFMEYCLDGCLSIEIYGQNIEPRDQIDQIELKSIKKNDNFNSQLAKYENLVQNWNELSKSFEIYIHILELNTDGNWTPVEVKQNELNKTGGIYQLKQGQSRQISVRIKQTKPNSKMWYNGNLFNLEPHKIDKVSVGSVLGREIGINQPLDSYQEIGLNTLKDKCKKILEARKQYLYEQLKELETLENDEDKERYELLCKQLVDLGEEQASIDAPADNSNLPGSTIDWQPNLNMEQHVPIVFLDLNNSLNKSLNDFDEYEVDFDDFDRIETKKTNNSIECGKDNYLKFEQKDTHFYDLKIIRWNNSEMIEFSTDGEVSENDLFDDSETIKAISLWDSSIHQSPYLNQQTPFDKHVYLTVKINLKLKVTNLDSKLKPTKYVDVTLRKRLSVNVYSPSVLASNRFTLKGFKTLLGKNITKNSVKSIASSEHSTGLIYRLISDIPKSLTEIENHESFAIKAATSLIEETNDTSKLETNETSMLFFEQYLKTIKNVDSLLKRDRIQQQSVIKKTSNLFYKNNELAKSFTNENKPDLQDELIEPKISGVPNLITRGFGSIINLTNYQAKETSLNRTTNDLQSEDKSNVKIIDSAEVNNLSFNDLLTDYQNNTNNALSKSYENQHNLNDNINNQINKSLNQSEINDNSISNNDINLSVDSKDKSDFLIEKTPENKHEIVECKKQIEIKQENENKASVFSTNLDADYYKSLSNSNTSIASTLTNSSQINSLTKERPQNQSQPEIIPDWIKDNTHIIVSTNSVQNKRGFVRYIGPTKFAPGIWIGVELEEAYGKNNGALKGFRYFKCPENKGVFVKADKLTLVLENKE